MEFFFITILMFISIVLLTTLILSLQHITFSLTFTQDINEETTENDTTEDNDNDEDDNDDDDNNDDDKDDDEEDLTENVETAVQMLDDGEDVDQILVELQNASRENIKQTCCFVTNFNCLGNDCTSGVEKRCGVFADKGCEESMLNCTLFSKEDCNKRPNSVYCKYNEDESKCENKVNAHKGSDLECSQYDRFKENNFPHMEYNCQDELIFI